MKILADKLTDYILRMNVISEQSYAMYHYGFQMGIELAICFFVSLVIAFLGNMLLEYFVFIIVFSMLRTYAGGFHFKSFGKCFWCSTFVQALVLFISKYYYVSFKISLAIIISCSIAILWLSPIGSSDRIIDETEKNYFKKKIIKVIVLINILAFFFLLAINEKYLFIIALAMFVVLSSQLIVLLRKLPNSVKYLEYE